MTEFTVGQAWLDTADIVIVIVLTILCEVSQKALRHWLIRTKREALCTVMDALFHEIMILGFISLLLTVVTDAGWTTRISAWISGKNARNGLQRQLAEEEDTVLESFEHIHITIFIVMIVFILQMLALICIGAFVSGRWFEWESLPARGDGDSIELRIGERTARSPRRFELTHQLWHKWAWPFKHQGVRGLLQWRALRHEFLYPTSFAGVLDSSRRLVMSCSWRGNVKVVRQPASFVFAEYLHRRLARLFAEMVDVTVITYILAILVSPFLVPLLIASSLWQLVSLLVMGWALLLVLWLFGVYIHDVHHQLVPTLPNIKQLVVQALDEQLTFLPAASLAERLRAVIETSQMDALFAATPMDSVGIPPFRRCFLEECQQAGGHRKCCPKARTSADLDPHSQLFFAKEHGPYLCSLLLEVLLFFQAVYISLLFVFVRSAVASDTFATKQAGIDIFEVIALITAMLPPTLNVCWLLPRVVGQLVIVTSVENLKDQPCMEEVEEEQNRMRLRSWLRWLRLLHLRSRKVCLGQDGGDVCRPSTGRSARASNSLNPIRAGRPSIFSTPRPSAFSDFASQLQAAYSRTDAEIGLGKIAEEKFKNNLERFSELPKRLQNQVERSFCAFDRNCSGTLDVEETVAVLSHFGISGDSEAAEVVTQLVRLVDRDDSGDLDLDEFKVLMVEALVRPSPQEQEDDLRKFFCNMVSRDASSGVGGSSNEGVRLPIGILTSALLDERAPLTREEVLNSICVFFKGSKSDLSESEFVQWVCSLDERFGSD